MNSPTPEQIRAARVVAGLTQSQAASLVGVGLRNWQQWEAGDRRMRAAVFRLFGVLCARPDLPEMLDMLKRGAP